MTAVNVYALIQCPACGGALAIKEKSGELACQDCGRSVDVVDGKPTFSAVPSTIQETEFRERGPEKGTPWRQANWRFLEREIGLLAPEAVVLDVGAGRGDFSRLVGQRSALSLDIYPYPEVDLVCDLTQVNPFREAVFDAVVLMNVLEHVFDTQKFLDEIQRILKPGGKLLVAIPFLLKEHQAPFDFVRYTQFSLREWGDQCGFIIEKLEGYYDPMFFLEQGTSNLKHAVFPQMGRLKNYVSRILLGGLQIFAALIAKIVGKGAARNPDEENSPAPIGYHVVYKKVEG